MARGTQHRKRRPTANARVASRAAGEGEAEAAQAPELGGPALLRAAARPREVGLRLPRRSSSSLGFVLFGVGSARPGSATSLQNFFSGTSAQRHVALVAAEEDEEHPKDAQAWRDLATKLEQDEKLDEAIAALRRYTTLKPKDQDALAELAGVYLRRAADWQTIYTASRRREPGRSRRRSTFQPDVGLAARRRRSASLRARSRARSRRRRARHERTRYQKFVELRRRSASTSTRSSPS